MAELLRALCAWLALAWGTLSFPTTVAGEAANVAVAGDFAYASRGAAGIEILRLPDGERRLVALAGLESVDDVAAADGLLFALDALPPGALAVYSLADPSRPSLRGAPVGVDVGPFSGVSAAAGRVAVSGGTGLLSLREYGAGGALGAEVATADFGRGQPDLRLSPDGRRAFVSVHRVGPHFALRVAELAGAPLRIEPRGEVALDTWGFTAGGARPASFPIQSALAGDTLLVAHRRGLALVGVADPAAPRLLRVVPVGVEPVAVDVDAGVAALVGSEPAPRLVLVDVRDPATPRLVRSVALPPGSRATGVALSPSRVVVAAGRAGLLAFERRSLGPGR